MTLLQVNNLTKHYKVSSGIFSPNTLVRANQNISFTLEKGKTLAIVGESGSGKSTLARQIIGIEKPTSGSICLDGKELRFKNRRDKRTRFKTIRMIFQNPYESLNPNVRIGHSLEQTLIINTKLGKKQRLKKIAETLEKVGLASEQQYRYAHMFSGGQRQRIAIARAILLEPSIIIADEPLSALDVSIQAQILNLIQSLQEEMGISFIFISHDLHVVEHIADSIMVMYNGRVVEQGNVSQIFDEPLHPYTQSLFASTPIYRNRFPNFLPRGPKKQVDLLDSACVFAERCQYCETRCTAQTPMLIEAEQAYKIACFKFE
ncbi:MAG: ATP-binding cassette domain-containing protein [Kangiellaceae bacterium]|nr:ATP-binding cassette domain-containing protein [Kangiellaceae bacterium]